MKKMLKKLVSAALVLSLGVCLASCGGNSSPSGSNPKQPSNPSGSAGSSNGAQSQSSGLSKEYQFSISSSSAVGSTVNRMMEHVVEKGAELSDGKLQFTHYAAGQLGSDSEVLTEVLSGNISIMAMASSNLVGTIQELGLFDMYCAISKADTMEKLFNDPEFRAQMQGWFEGVGLKLIMWDPVTMKNFISITPIESIDDFKNYDIRVLNNANQISFWSAAGANPMALSASETYLSLQSKMVYGLENGLSTLLSFKYQEVTNYIMETRFLNHLQLIIMNLDAYNSMTAEDQAWFDGFCDTMNEDYAAMAASDQDAAWGEMTAAGLTKIEFNQQLFDDMRAVAEGSEWVLIRQDLGDELVDSYLASIARIEG